MMTLVRRQDWPMRLARFLEQRQAMPFAWGGNDCISFAVQWVEAMTGVRVVDVDWTDAESAMAKLKEKGGIRAAWRGVLGAETQNWRMIRRGDVAIVENVNGRECGTVCTGTTLAGPDVERMVHLPLDRALMVWRIG